MADSPVKRNTTILDPAFPIPLGLADFAYDDKASTNTPSAEVESDGSGFGAIELGDIFIDSGEAPDDTSGVPLPPDTLEVISQQIRTAPGGQQVVDIVIEVEDIPGVSKYEFRVTKV